MNRLMLSLLLLVAVSLGAVPAKAVTISYDTGGSTSKSFIFTPTSTGDITYPGDSTFTLSEKFTFLKKGYGEAYSYIPFSVAANTFISATLSDLNATDSKAKPLEWMDITLFEYTGSGDVLADCATGSSLCTLIDYDGTPPTASIAAALVAGTQYLLRVGFGLCGCTLQYGGINLTVATTPIPPAIFLFMSALVGVGGLAWRRRRAEVALA